MCGLARYAVGETDALGALGGARLALAGVDVLPELALRDAEAELEVGLGGAAGAVVGARDAGGAAEVAGLALVVLEEVAVLAGRAVQRRVVDPAVAAGLEAAEEVDPEVAQPELGVRVLEEGDEPERHAVARVPRRDRRSEELIKITIAPEILAHALVVTERLQLVHVFPIDRHEDTLEMYRVLHENLETDRDLAMPANLRVLPGKVVIPPDVHQPVPLKNILYMRRGLRVGLQRLVVEQQVRAGARVAVEVVVGLLGALAEVGREVEGAAPRAADLAAGPGKSVPSVAVGALVAPAARAAQAIRGAPHARALLLVPVPALAAVAAAVLRVHVVLAEIHGDVRQFHALVLRGVGLVPRRANQGYSLGIDPGFEHRLVATRARAPLGQRALVVLELAVDDLDHRHEVAVAALHAGLDGEVVDEIVAVLAASEVELIVGLEVEGGRAVVDGGVEREVPPDPEVALVVVREAVDEDGERGDVALLIVAVAPRVPEVPQPVRQVEAEVLVGAVLQRHGKLALHGRSVVPEPVKHAPVARVQRVLVVVPHA